MQKKMTALFLILALFLPTLASCASGDPETDASAAPVPEETVLETFSYGDDLPDTLDFGGREFRVATYNGGNLTHEGGWYNYIQLEGTTGDIVNDAAFQRNLEVEERLNNTIVCLEIADWNNVLNTVKNSVSAGEDAYDIVLECSQGNYTSLISANMLYDAAALPHVDFSKSYYTKDALDTFAIDGHHYLFSGTYTYPLYSGVYWLFNKDMWTDYDLPDPYELVREGKWTADTALSFVKNVYVDVNGDSKQDIGDKYGFSSSNEMLQYLYLGFGMHGVIYENETFTYDYETEQAVDVLNKIISWAQTTPEAYFNSSDQWGNFFAGNSLMLLYGSSLPRLRDLEFTFGFLPMPKYDEQQEDYKSYMCGGMVCIPVTISDDDFVGATIEALFSASDRYLVPAYLNKFVDHKILRDEGSVEMYRLLLETASYDLTRYISPNANVQNLKFILNLIKKKSTDISSEWAKIEQKVKTDFDAFYSEYHDNTGR